jgi:YegS C-terminal NAD kinase beta sandwich-like domain
VTRPLRPGEPWGHAASGPPDVEVAGDDADLVAAAASHPGALVRFRPSPRSDLARALGLGSDGAGTTEVAIDALAIDLDDDVVGAVNPVDAVNVVVLGPPPDRLRWTARASHVTVRVDGRAWFSGRATTVVVANGQFLRGADIVPRGHPGDGSAEVQVYALARRARRGMRRRLPTGTHVPHPDVRSGRARRVEVEVAGPRLPVEVDGRRQGRAGRLVVTLVPAAIRLLV